MACWWKAPTWVGRESGFYRFALEALGYRLLRNFISIYFIMVEISRNDGMRDRMG